METPSSRILAAAAATLHTVDAEGRKLELRRLGALDKLRLFKAVGPSLSQNAPYLGMAMLASSVTAIDGVPVPPPVTELQVEQMIARLGDPGISAVAEALQPEPSVSGDTAMQQDASQAADQDGARAAGN